MEVRYIKLKYSIFTFFLILILNYSLFMSSIAIKNDLEQDDLTSMIGKTYKFKYDILKGSNYYLKHYNKFVSLTLSGNDTIPLKNSSTYPRTITIKEGDITLIEIRNISKIKDFDGYITFYASIWLKIKDSEQEKLDTYTTLGSCFFGVSSNISYYKGEVEKNKARNIPDFHKSYDEYVKKNRYYLEYKYYSDIIGEGLFKHKSELYITKNIYAFNENSNSYGKNHVRIVSLDISSIYAKPDLFIFLADEIIILATNPIMYFILAELLSLIFLIKFLSKKGVFRK